MQHKIEVDFNVGGGTSLYGYLNNVSYQDLVKAFGKPSKGDEYKIDAEWCGRINGEDFTIYNWKDGKNYNGASGTPKTKITEWHIGAASPRQNLEVVLMEAIKERVDQ